MGVLRFTAAFMAAVCLCSTASCGASKSSSQGNDTSASQSAADGTSSVWHENRIEPDTGSEEYDLGSYYVSPSGIKLYFEPEEFPPELVLTLEKYFRSYAENDYDTYTSCVYPSYVEEMNKFLEKDYGYGLEKSFSNQCDSLNARMKGDFTITRIRLENYEGDLAKFFESPSSCFGKDYYSEISGEVGKFYDAMFFIMAEDHDGHESSLISEYEIVFAEKDGKYYIFG